MMSSAAFAGSMNVGERAPCTAIRLSTSPAPVERCRFLKRKARGTFRSRTAWPALPWGAVRPTVAVFGGSFNPPHVAHVLACALLLSVQQVDRVLVVPTFRHPFAKSLAAFEERLRMC